MSKSTASLPGLGENKVGGVRPVCFVGVALIWTPSLSSCGGEPAKLANAWLRSLIAGEMSP